MAFRWPNKDPNEVIKYPHDWGPRLGADTIVSSTLIVETGNVVLDAIISSGKTRTYVLSGGTHGTMCKLTICVTTSGGETLEEGIRLAIRQR